MAQEARQVTCYLLLEHSSIFPSHSCHPALTLPEVLLSTDTPSSRSYLLPFRAPASLSDITWLLPTSPETQGSPGEVSALLKLTCCPQHLSLVVFCYFHEQTDTCLPTIDRPWKVTTSCLGSPFLYLDSYPQKTLTSKADCSLRATMPSSTQNTLESALCSPQSGLTRSRGPWLQSRMGSCTRPSTG